MASAIFDNVNIAPTPPEVDPSTQVKLANLKYGMRNADVKDYQSALIRKGFSIPSGATGYFGTETRAATKAVQKKLGLKQTGTPTKSVCAYLGLQVIA